MVKLIDNKIDRLAKQLQIRNNLDNIEYLKMKLFVKLQIMNLISLKIHL